MSEGKVNQLDNFELLKQIASKQQDLVRDCQYCLNHSNDPRWQEFFGSLARENAALAHRCLDHLKN